MERVTVAMSVFGRLELTRACLDSLRATTEPFRLAVVDNGSTDETPRFFERFPYPFPLIVERNPTNQPVIAALNRAWRMATSRSLIHTLSSAQAPRRGSLAAAHSRRRVGRGRTS